MLRTAFLALAAAGSVAAGQTLVINEVDYDQFGVDTAEFIEIKNTGSAPVALAGIHVVLVDGLLGLEYARYDLGPLGTLPGRGYLVLHGVQVEPPAGVLSMPFALPANNIQNGSPDGIALINTNDGTLIDALSYEGSVLGVLLQGLAGVVDLVRGLPLGPEVADANSSPMSLARIPDGRVSGSDAADWQLVLAPSPGRPNSGGNNPCAGPDFDGDGDAGTDADIEAFFRCLSGECCATCWGLGADVDADGDAGTDADIESFFRVLAGGAC